MATAPSVTIAPKPTNAGSGPGLDRIVHGAPSGPSYGWSENLSPADLQSISALDQLFEMPDIGDFILQSLQIPLDDPSLLQPQHFAKALSTAEPQLRAAAEVAPDLALLLGRVAGLMLQVQGLHGLKQANTTALLQG